MRLMILYCLFCATVLGCEAASGPREKRESTLQELNLSALQDLPQHWRHIVDEGIDTAVGRFVSSEKELVIHYDIGELAGEYASAKAYPHHQWIRSGRLAESSFRFLLDYDHTLYVTFPDEGPANFWAKVKNPGDIDYLLELLARHRQKLLQKKVMDEADLRIDNGAGIWPPDDFTGVWETYWPNGQIKFRANYVNGQEDGEVTCWWANGQLAQTGQSKNGVCQGI